MSTVSYFLSFLHLFKSVLLISTPYQYIPVITPSSIILTMPPNV